MCMCFYVRLANAGGPGSFLCSFRFALSILCFLMTMNLYAQRMGMSVAIVCMVNHTAVVMMRDVHSSSSSSSSGDSLTTTPSEWKQNESEDATEPPRSRCDSNLVAGSNRSVAMVTNIIDQFVRFWTGYWKEAITVFFTNDWFEQY